MSVAEYVGRTVDIAAFQGMTLREKVLLRQALADPGLGGTIVTGIAKLGQRFLLELLTERGSMLYKERRGSTFMLEARRGSIRTQADLMAAFSRALLDVSRSLAAEEQETDAADERFGDAEIINVALFSGRAVVYVRVSSQDPQARVILPVAYVF